LLTHHRRSKTIMRKHFLILLLWISLFALVLPAAAQSRRTESFKGQDGVAGEILVRFRGATGFQAQAIAAQDTDILSTDLVGNSGAVRLRSRARDVNSLLQAYQNRLDVLYAEPNYVWHAYDIPNDVLFG